MKRVLFYELLELDETVIAKSYSRQLNNVTKSNRKDHLMDEGSWKVILLHDNARRHRVLLFVLNKSFYLKLEKFSRTRCIPTWIISYSDRCSIL